MTCKFLEGSSMNIPIRRPDDVAHVLRTAKGKTMRSWLYLLADILPFCELNSGAGIRDAADFGAFLREVGDADREFDHEPVRSKRV